MPRFLWILVFSLALAACNEQTAGTPSGDGVQPTVVSFSLLDAETQESLEPFGLLSEDATVNLARIPEAVSLRANTEPETVGSVRFDFGASSYVDASAPYILSAQDGWTPSPEVPVLATALSADGSSSAPLRLTFSAPNAINDALKRYLYVFRTSAIDVFDIDQNHEKVKSLKLPGGINRIWGATAHAQSHMLYISYHGRDAQKRFETGLLKYDLVAEKVVWKHLYEPFVDSPAITADGKTIFMSSGEATNKGDFWFVLDAADGSVKDKINVFRGAHNTIVGLSDKNVYMGSVRYPYLVVADTQTHQITQKIGPFEAGVRPFTVNGKETLAFVTVNQHLGFEVGDIASGKKLYTASVPGYPEAKWKRELQVQSHGIALSPDETELWVVDGLNKSLHIFDVTGLPGKAPVYKTSVKLQGSLNWVQFSRDGRFVYTSGGAVIDASTRQVVAQTSNAKVRIQIDFLDGVPANAYVRYGLGYVTN